MPFDFFKSVQATPLEPVMVLIGPDGFIRQKLRESLVERALGSAIREMNYAKFYAKEDSLARAIDACRDYPCFAERRVVLILEIGKIKKKESVGLVRYVENPQPTTVLILEDEKLDGRLDWVKILKKRATLLEIPSTTVYDAEAWVKKCFAREGKSPGPGVVEKLVEMIGTSLGVLQQSVTQLSLFVGDRNEVKCEDLDSLLVKVSEENVFEVINSLFSGELCSLHRALGRLLESGEPPLKILALIYRHLNILLTLRFGQPGEVWRLFRMAPSFRREYESQARRFGERLNYSLFKPIVEADLKLKSSPLDNKLILKNCVEEIGGLLS